MNLRQKIGLNIVKASFLRLALSLVWPVLVGARVLVTIFCIGILLLVPGKVVAQEPYLPKTEKVQYGFTPGKIIGWASLAIGGFADGALEGYQFDSRKSFERKWNSDPYGFWGSQSWRMIYNEGNPQMGVKSKIHNWLGAVDFYHVADDTRKIGYIGGGITLGISGCKANKKWWHWALDIGISSIISSSAKSLGMKWVRS